MTHATSYTLFFAAYYALFCSTPAGTFPLSDNEKRTPSQESTAADAKAAEEFKVAEEAVATAQKALGDS